MGSGKGREGVVDLSGNKKNKSFFEGRVTPEVQDMVPKCEREVLRKEENLKCLR